MQINKANNVNFTSAVPLKVFINGLPSTDVANIRKAVVATSKILTSPANADQKSLSIIRKFIKSDRDFSYTDGGVKSGVLIRNIISQGQAYLFTGEHAKILNELGKKIGPAKSQGLAQFNTTKTFESSTLTKNYFDKIREFLSYPLIRVKESINPKTRMYEGDLLELNILAKTEGKAGKNGFKLVIDDISFQPIKKLQVIVAEPAEKAIPAPINTKNKRKKAVNPDNQQTKLDL